MLHIVHIIDQTKIPTPASIPAPGQYHQPPAIISSPRPASPAPGQYHQHHQPPASITSLRPASLANDQYQPFASITSLRTASCRKWTKHSVLRMASNWYIEVDETYICGHLCVTLLLFCIYSRNPWVLYSGVEVSCCISVSASWAPGVIGGHRRNVAELSMLFNVNSNSDNCSVRRASICFY